MSHELRTPLTAIIGYTELLKEGLPHPLHDAQRRPVQRVGLSARHLKQLIDEILAFSRLEAGKEQVREEDVSVEDVLAEIEAVIDPLAKEKGLEFRVASGADPAALRTDPSKLRQILLNLLGNAVKFTEEGQVTLTVRRDHDHVLFEVTDTGSGIEADELENVYEPFWRGDTSNAGSKGGTGLGLTICDRYAQLLGGGITMQSEAGAGTTASLRLPQRGAEIR